MTPPNLRPVSMPEVPSGAPPRLPRLTEAEGFLEDIKHGWARPARTPRVVPGAAQAAARHRDLLSARLPNEVLVATAGHAPVRSNDFQYVYRPNSDFFWLTGCAAEGAVLLMLPKPGGHDSILFIDPPAGPGVESFFADPARGELWIGANASISEWSEALDLTVAPMSGLPTALASLGTPHATHRVGPVEWPDPLLPSTASTVMAAVLSELRMYKDFWELEQLRSAVGVTIDGFRAVLAEVPAAAEGLGERWLQGTFERHARTVGNGPGYTTIVGSGPHAPTLHWVECDGPVLPDHLLLLDMGVEMRSLYTADVTRTFPVSGTFNSAQRMVHDLVEESHRAGLSAVKPGNRFADFHHAVMEVIAEGLRDWGLLQVSVDEALAPEGQQHRRYLACGVGHHLGLDVHDCASSSYEAYQGGVLAEGMVLTVEPGLYFHAHDMTVPPELRGLGVRIEDDVEVTHDGSKVLSEALPISASALEEWMFGASVTGQLAEPTIATS